VRVFLWNMWDERMRDRIVKSRAYMTIYDLTIHAGGVTVVHAFYIVLGF
jgi:hypothetical protein